MSRRKTSLTLPCPSSELHGLIRQRIDLRSPRESHNNRIPFRVPPMQPSNTPNPNSANYTPDDPFMGAGMVPVYAVVDACQAWEWVQRVREQFGRDTKMLFQGAGTVYDEVEEVAPYLCSLDPENVLLLEWSALLGSNAGILIASDAPIAVLHKHLRNVFIAKDSTDQDYFFRFYDPRVLRGFLPACRTEEVHKFFGPIRWIVVEDIQPNKLIAYTYNQGRLLTKQFPVSHFLEQFNLPDSSIP